MGGVFVFIDDFGEVFESVSVDLALLGGEITEFGPERLGTLSVISFPAGGGFGLALADQGRGGGGHEGIGRGLGCGLGWGLGRHGVEFEGFVFVGRWRGGVRFTIPFGIFELTL